LLSLAHGTKLGAAVLLAVLICAAQVRAAGVVSTCNEASLNGALAGGGLVTFSCSGTIVLTSTITISTNTTIDATGQSVTLSGSDQRRIFTVNSGIIADFVGLTIADGLGSGGGAINSMGTLNISHCSLISNSTGTLSGGAVRITAGTASITDSSFIGNSSTSTTSGGAIYINVSAGLVSITNSTFSGNNAGGTGGAIRNDGTLNITNSTFNSNNASGNLGGAISTL
jgi:predicted outer membrane repeat protein